MSVMLAVAVAGVSMLASAYGAYQSYKLGKESANDLNRMADNARKSKEWAERTGARQLSLTNTSGQKSLARTQNLLTGTVFGSDLSGSDLAILEEQIFNNVMELADVREVTRQEKQAAEMRAQGYDAQATMAYQTGKYQAISTLVSGVGTAGSIYNSRQKTTG